MIPYSLKSALLIITGILFHSSAAQAIFIGPKLGSISISPTPTEGDKAAEGGFIFYGLEAGAYLSHSSQVFTTIQFASDSELNLVKYQSANIGYRGFPFNIGRGLEEEKSRVLMSYEYFYSPYYEVSLGLGRYLSTVTNLQGILEKTSTFLGIRTGLGTYVEISSSFSLDLSLALEIDTGISGSVPNFSAQNLLISSGLIWIL